MSMVNIKTLSQKLMEVSGKEGEVEQATKKLAANVCTACLGLLQQGCDLDNLRKVRCAL